MQILLGVIKMEEFHRGGVNAQYSTMKLEDIKKLPIQQLADDTCVLLMWATFPQLQEALEVIKAWGFKY
ncbi:MAG: hypothetical protein RLZZ546_2153, partial [Bacteroidota bacterium]